MKDTYQFWHVFAYYAWNQRLAYSYNRIELGDAYEKYSTIYWRMSNTDGF